MTTTVSETVESQIEAVRIEAFARWRKWVRAVANGKPVPKAEDILATAGAMGLADPGAAFDHDVEVLTEFMVNERAAASCAAARAALLDPWGGSAEKLEAAAADAEAKAKALSDTLSQYRSGCYVDRWNDANLVLRRRNPRALGAL